MDRLRELTGFVQRLSGGGSGTGSANGGDNAVFAGAGGAERRRDVSDGLLRTLVSRYISSLSHLPLTQTFLDQLPRKQIEQTAKDNEAKAAVAHQLLQRVDELVDSHITTAASLSTFLTQLSTIPESLAQANTLAQSIHNQLTTLSTLIATEESHLSTTSLTALQREEDIKFSEYVRERNAVLEQKKAKYAQQLDGFRKERVRMIAAGEGGGSQDAAGGNTNGGRLTTLRGQPSRQQTPHSGVSTGIAGVTLGLEHVTLTEDTRGVGRRDLDNFFDRGDGEGGDRTVSIREATKPVALTLKSQTLPPELVPQNTVSLASPSQCPLEKRSCLPPTAPRTALPSRNPTLLPGIIAADEDFDAADSDAIASLYGKGKKGKKKRKK